MYNEGAEAEAEEALPCHGRGSEFNSRRSRMCLDPKMFPDQGNEKCTHSIGLYKSGRCRACGFKVMESLRKRAYRLGLMHLIKTRHYETHYSKPRGGWSFT